MKIIQKNGARIIDKKEIDKLLAAKKFIGLNKSPRAEKVIVSLTSYDLRINDLKYTIYSLLNQNFPPDKLILWLDEESFPRREKDLPRDLLKLKAFGLTIDWCENLRSYKKLIPALEKYPNDIIVTADDDLFYRPDWLAALYKEHLKAPNCAIAHYTHKIRLNQSGIPFPFNQWQLNLSPQISLPAMLSYSFGTGGGVLFKNSFFHSDVLRRELFQKLAPLADDLWFGAMLALNKTKIKIPANPMGFSSFIDVEIASKESGSTLKSENWDKQHYDVQLRQIIEHYPKYLDILIREAAENKPYISVILPASNPNAISASIQNFFLQGFPNFELIIINLGSPINLPSLPTNFHVINYPGGLFGDALNLGLQKAAGDYILFKDENSILPWEALEIVAKTVDDSKGDVIHFAAHINLADKRPVIDDSPELKRDTPIFLDAPRQLRAVMWLQNKLNRRLDTKIFKRDFLLKHGINLDNDITEFIFQALIQAEKYLIVPSAFCFCK